MPVRRSSNHIPSSPAGKQGIVTILGADFKPASIRRTLSADMSSKKWLQQNGFFSPTKQPEELDGHNNKSNPNQDEVWRSIQAQKETQKPPPQTGVWSMLLTQKSDSSLLNTPYVHPLVKRSNSSLSEKSLEVCTESLGSETGSDCFSCHSDGDEEREEVEQRSEKEEVQVQQRSGDDPFADAHVVKYKKSPARPLPPPLPSIAGGLHVHSHREEGRLVLEAVSVAPRNFFNADRQNGRLRLTLKHGPANLEDELEEEKVQFMEAVDDDVEETVDRGYSEVKSGGRKEDQFMVVEQENLSLPTGTGMISVHKSMKKLMAVGNINPKWSDDLAARDEFPVPQSLPPRPPSAARLAGTTASSFNAYEYFWRSKPGFMSTNNNKKKVNQELVAYMRRGCKEARRSLLREPYCIATS